MTPRTIQVITRSEEVAFLQGLKAHDPRYHMAAFMLIQTGMRIGELCSIRIADVYNGKQVLKSIELTPSQTKNKKARTIPLSSSLRTALYEFLLQSHSESKHLAAHYPLFMSAKGKTPIGPRDYQRTFAKIGKLSIQRKVNPHLLRHTLVTRLLKVMNPLDVAALVGHEDPRTTMHYNHLDVDEVAEAIDRSNGKV